MTAQERDALIEAVTSAFRPRDALTSELRASDAWHDLDEAGRAEAFERTIALRELESAMDGEGYRRLPARCWLGSELDWPAARDPSRRA
jgi:hypothetical protein